METDGGRRRDSGELKPGGDAVHRTLLNDERVSSRGGPRALLYDQITGRDTCARLVLSYQTNDLILHVLPRRYPSSPSAAPRAAAALSFSASNRSTSRSIAPRSTPSPPSPFALSFSSLTSLAFASIAAARSSIATSFTAPVAARDAAASLTAVCAVDSGAVVRVLLLLLVRAVLYERTSGWS